jgi:hypothetical protein
MQTFNNFYDSSPGQQTQSNPPARIRRIAEIATSNARVLKSKAETEKLADTDHHAWMKTLLLRHSIQKGMGLPSDFSAKLDRAISCGNWEFLEAATKALKEISKTDKRQHLIVRTLLEAFKDLRRLRHEQLLEETSAEHRSELNRLKEQDPEAYRCAIEEFRIRNLPNNRTQKTALPTMAEVRIEATKRIVDENPKWEIPETDDWSRYFKLAKLANLPKGKAGRHRKNVPTRSGKGRKSSTNKVQNS